MELLLMTLIIIILLAAFSTFAAEYGVDSRESSDDPHRSSYPVGIG